MHVADLNGTHLGKTITVTTKGQTITGILWRVDHDGDRITEQHILHPDTHYLGRIVHRLTIGAVDGSLPADAAVEVHP